jgi:hypothetical protein
MAEEDWKDFQKVLGRYKRRHYTADEAAYFFLMVVDPAQVGEWYQGVPDPVREALVRQVERLPHTNQEWLDWRVHMLDGTEESRAAERAAFRKRVVAVRSFFKSASGFPRFLGSRALRGGTRKTRKQVDLGGFRLRREGLPMPEYRVRRLKTTENLPEVIEPLASAWVEAAHTAKRRRILDSATQGQRLLCAYYFYWDDVTNGGHWQYFGNYTGNLWPEALEATQALSLPEKAILRDAVALFPDRQPELTQRGRRRQLATIDRAQLDELDERFYALPGEDQKIRAYIDGHPDEFFLPRRSR